MTWTIAQIETEWNVSIEYPEITLEAFERVERVLGLEWIGKIRNRSGFMNTGPAPFLQVVSMGGRLQVLDSLADSKLLVNKLKRGDVSAVAELTAMHLLLWGIALPRLSMSPTS